MKTEAEQRKRVVEVARTWVGTPYHTAGRVKGAGVDCLTILAEVYHEAGLIERADIPYYPADWHLHKDTERYLEGVARYATEFEGPPLPGDIVVWRFGRCFSHGAIVTEWPQVIHAYVGTKVCTEDALKARWLTHVGEGRQGGERQRKYFTYWGK